jgi:uncharacterized protein YndB with AHSA1/START domain
VLEALPDGLRIVRTIPGERADVFDAWVAPDRLRSWWGPPGVAVSALDGELRVGGSYRITMEVPGGERRVLVWTFHEIVAPARLVYSWRWDNGPETGAESIVTVEFRDVGGGTEIDLVHTGIADRQVRESHAQGWLGCLDGLEAERLSSR